MYLSHLPMSLKILSAHRPKCCTHALLRETISSFSLLWSQQTPKSCFTGPIKLVACCTYYKCCLLPNHKMLFNTDVTDSETSYFEQPLYTKMVKKLMETSVCTFLQSKHLRSLKNGHFFQQWQVIMLFCLQSLLGEFNKEQEAFIKEKQGKVSDAAVPPWVGCPNEESLKEEFLTLSTVSALQFIHIFCLITAAFLMTHKTTLTVLKAVYFACFYCIMTLLCMPLHQVTLTTLLVLPATVSGYTHISLPCSKIICVVCLYVAGQAKLCSKPPSRCWFPVWLWNNLSCCHGHTSWRSQPWEDEVWTGT